MQVVNKTLTILYVKRLSEQIEISEKSKIPETFRAIS